MYICVSVLGSIVPGQILILERDEEFGEISAKETSGAVIGFMLHEQPQGCISAFRAMQRINSQKIIAQAAVVSGGVALLSSIGNWFEPSGQRRVRITGAHGALESADCV